MWINPCSQQSIFSERRKGIIWNTCLKEFEHWLNRLAAKQLWSQGVVLLNQYRHHNHAVLPHWCWSWYPVDGPRWEWLCCWCSLSWPCHLRWENHDDHQSSEGQWCLPCLSERHLQCFFPPWERRLCWLWGCQKCQHWAECFQLPLVSFQGFLK